MEQITKTGEYQAANSYVDLVYERPLKTSGDPTHGGLGKGICLPPHTIVIYPTLAEIR